MSEPPVVRWDPATGVVFTDAPSWPIGAFTPAHAVQLVPADELVRELERLRRERDEAERVAQMRTRERDAAREELAQARASD